MLNMTIFCAYIMSCLFIGKTLRLFLTRGVKAFVFVNVKNIDLYIYIVLNFLKQQKQQKKAEVHMLTF